MRKFIESLKARREASKNEGGFSLIDVVITVAIIVALSVGGFVTYSGIVDNAKSAATAAAADQVYTAAALFQNDGYVNVDGEASTTLQAIEDDYNASANGITVEIGGLDEAGAGDWDGTVTASNDKNSSITATRGN